MRESNSSSSSSELLMLDLLSIVINVFKYSKIYQNYYLHGIKYRDIRVTIKKSNVTGGRTIGYQATANHDIECYTQNEWNV